MDAYSVHGKRIFKNDTERDAHLPTQELRERFASLVDPISTFTSFGDKSKLDYTLTLNLGADNMTSAQMSMVSDYLGSFSDNNKCREPTNKQHFLNWADLTNANIPSKEQANRILDRLEQELSGLEGKPLSFGTFHEDYKAVIDTICFENLKTNWQRYVNIDQSFVQQMTESTMLNQKNALVNYVESEVDHAPTAFIKNCSTGDGSTYWAKVVSAVKEYDKSSISTEFRKMFMIFYYPYFLFSYMIENVARKDMKNPHTPRLFLFQRFAVVAVYTFIFYTVMTILQNLNNNVASDAYQRAYMQLAKVNDTLFANESIIDQENFDGLQMQNMSNGPYQLSNVASSLESRIQQMHANLTKSAYADAQLQRRYRRARMYMIFWSIMLGITMILPFIFIVLNYDVAFYVSWVILCAIVVIGLIVHFVTGKR